MADPSGWLTIEQNFLGLGEPCRHPDQAGVHVLRLPTNIRRVISKGPTTVDVSEIAPIDGFAAPQFSIARLVYRLSGLIHVGRRRTPSVR